MEVFRSDVWKTFVVYVDIDINAIHSLLTFWNRGQIFDIYKSFSATEVPKQPK